MPTDKEIEVAEKSIMKSITQAFSEEACQMDFGDVAKAALEAAEKVRQKEFEDMLDSSELVEEIINSMGRHMPLIKDVIIKINPATMEKCTEVHKMPYFEMRKKYMPDIAKAAIKVIIGKCTNNQ